MKVKIAVVQPTRIVEGNEKEENLGRACNYVDQAAAMGAKFVCFPEGYPGPRTREELYYPEETLSKKALEHRLYVICGGMHPDKKNPECNNVTATLIGPDGKIGGHYYRTTPAAPWVYFGNAIGIFNMHYATGNELPVFDTEYGKIGILICSEVYPPELARVLAVKGAEMIFIPNGTSRRSMRETWATLIKARAYENCAVTVTCKNVINNSDGFAMIVDPEKQILYSETEGVFAAEVDLGHLRWLRSQEETAETFREWPHGTKPGLLTQWRRPELYAELVKPVK